MARRKVKLAFIANDSARKASFRKRKNGLLKKMKELSTLCDVTVSAIIYIPGENQPEIWPPSVSELNAVLTKFREMPQMNQRKKMVDQERFLMQRIVKVGEQYKKQVRDNREKELVLTMYGNLDGTLSLEGMSSGNLEELGSVIDKTLAEIHDTRQRLLTNKQTVEELQWLSPPATSVPFTGVQMESPSEIKPAEHYMQSQPYWSIDCLNAMLSLPPLEMTPPPPPQLLHPPKLQLPQMQPQTAGDYFFNGGDFSVGGSYIGGDQPNVTMFPFYGDHPTNFNTTSSASSTNPLLWPNNSTNLLYP